MDQPETATPFPRSVEATGEKGASSSGEKIVFCSRENVTIRLAEEAVRKTHPSAFPWVLAGSNSRREP